VRKINAWPSHCVESHLARPARPRPQSCRGRGRALLWTGFDARHAKALRNIGCSPELTWCGRQRLGGLAELPHVAGGRDGAGGARRRGARPGGDRPPRRDPRASGAHNATRGAAGDYASSASRLCGLRQLSVPAVLQLGYGISGGEVTTLVGEGSAKAPPSKLAIQRCARGAAPFAYWDGPEFKNWSSGFGGKSVLESQSWPTVWADPGLKRRCSQDLQPLRCGRLR
jgi:hypothetical protein